MYKSISVIVFSLLIFITLSVKASRQCTDLLSIDVQKTASTSTVQNETTAKAIQILDRMKEIGIITDIHYFEHARADLKGTVEEIEEKMEHEIFQKLFEKWSALMDKTLLQFEKYDQLSEEDKKTWRGKLEVVGKFSISQFVTFVEAEGKVKSDPLYRKQNQILTFMNSLPSNAGFKIFSYELEKQIKRFFSVSEIIRCKF